MEYQQKNPLKYYILPFCKKINNQTKNITDFIFGCNDEIDNVSISSPVVGFGIWWIKRMKILPITYQVK
jgi:hypothetical protein